MIRPDLVHPMDSTMADFQPSAVRTVRNLVKGVIDRRNFKDQIDFLEKLHLKFQNFYPMGLPPAQLSSPYLQKIVKMVPGRISGGHHFEEVDIAAAYISEHLRWHPMI